MTRVVLAAASGGGRAHANCGVGGASDDLRDRPLARGHHERRALNPPAATATDVAMVPIPAPTTFRGYPADLLMISAFDGARRPVTDQRDIEAAVPWPIVLPSYLPPGYGRIGLVQVDQPRSGLPAETR